MTETIRPSLVVLVVLTLVTGVAYPALITMVAQLALPSQANGSLIIADGKPIGSTLIGQPFAQPGHFWGRPSATAPVPYNAASSSGSNLGPLHPDLAKNAQGRLDALHKLDPAQNQIPVDLVTASGSGLDPHISPEAAEGQVRRVASTRNLGEDEVRAVVERHTEGRQLGVLGEPRVNVLELNLDLDQVAAQKGRKQP